MAKNKKGLSKAKRTNITNSKLSKQSKLRSGKKKQKSGHLTPRTPVDRLKLQNDNEEQNDNDITVSDMLEMVDDQDLWTLGLTNSIDTKHKKQKLDEIERKGRRFEDAEIHLGSGRKLKPMLPVVSDDGWVDRKGIISTDKPDFLLTHFTRPEGVKKKKRRRKKKEEDNEKDSGISEDENEQENQDEEEVERDDDDDDQEEKSVVHIMAKRERSLAEIKIKMACYASAVIEDPKKVSNLRNLVDMLELKDPSGSHEISVTGRRYLLFTLLQVFHDLIPSYRVQENSLEKKVSKGMLEIQRIELAFLSYYRKYLESLEAILTDVKKSPQDIGLKALGETSLHCLGDMLVRHPYFNYSLNIIQFLVPFLTHSEAKFRKLAFDPLCQTIRSDKKCTLTVKIVKRIYHLFHRLRFKVKEDALKVFLSLRASEMKNTDLIFEQQKTNSKELSVREKMIKKLVDKTASIPSRKKRKEIKKMAKIRDEMADITAKEALTTQNQNHSEIIQDVFGIYFHILKKKPNSKLMPTVLEGLSKFAHLINIDFFSDLLEVLHSLLQGGSLGRRESLFCIQTVFTILSGQGEYLNVDPQRFYNSFFTILADATLYEKEEIIESILQVVQQMLILRKKKVSSAKVISFAKRLATISLTLSHRAAIPLLAVLKKLFTMFPATEALLDPDPDGSPGTFIQDSTDPEHANAAGSACWELVAVKRHYHPSVQILASNILTGGLAREDPRVFSLVQRTIEKLLDSYDTSKLKFNPVLPLPDAHLKNRKIPYKQLFQDGLLDLDNLKLQSICEHYVNEEDSNNIEQPKRKKRKINIKEDDFYTSYVDGFKEEKSPISESNDDFTSYYVGRK